MIMDFLKYIKDLFVALVNTFFDALIDLFYYILDMIFSGLVEVLNLFASQLHFLDFSKYFDKMPSEFLNALSALGVSEIFAIFIAAHTTKTILQLIPFVRLGAK